MEGEPRDTRARIFGKPSHGRPMNLQTKYLGLDLRTPLVPSSSPLCEDLDNLKRMEDAGAAAIVLPSLFEEQIRHETHTASHFVGYGPGGAARAARYFPDAEDFNFAPERYLEHLAAATQALDIPVIASLNGCTFGRWISYGRAMEQAGAAAIELNLYSIPTDPDVSSEEIETSYLTIVASIKAQAVFHQLRAFCPAGGTAWRRRARSLQSLLPAGYRPHHVARDSQFES